MNTTKQSTLTIYGDKLYKSNLAKILWSVQIGVDSL